MGKRTVVLRTPSGISGDMLVAGFAKLLAVDNGTLNTIVDSIGMPLLSHTVEVIPWSVNNISGWRAKVSLPHEHVHRSHRDIQQLIDVSELSVVAKVTAKKTFTLLAKAEGAVHGIAPDEVTFHEVGALDSIIDICLCAELYERLKVETLHCSPLPICDGVVRCAHGLLASPAPAVQELLSGVPVYGIASQGETVTPTALAFLKAIDTQFGEWPQLTVDKVFRVYGSRVLPDVPNGAIFTMSS